MKTKTNANAKGLTKRCFGLLLAAATALSLLTVPVMVSAAPGDTVDVSANAETRIFFTESAIQAHTVEPEGSNPSSARQSLLADKKAYGHVNYGKRTGEGVDPSLNFTIKVNAAVEGDYLLRAVGMFSKTENWISGISVQVNGAEEQAPVVMKSSVVNNYVATEGSTTKQTSVAYVKVHLNSGVNTVVYNVLPKSAYNEGEGRITFALDFVDVIPLILNAGDEESTIPACYLDMAAAYTDKYFTNNPAEPALPLGEQKLTVDGTEISDPLQAIHINENQPVPFEITLNAERDGLYNIKYYMASGSADMSFKSQAKVWLDDGEESAEVVNIKTPLAENPNKYVWTSKCKPDKNNLSMSSFYPNEYVEWYQFLSAGRHTLHITFQQNSGHVAASVFEKVSVSPCDVPTLKPHVPMEAESCIDVQKPASVTTVAGSSSGSVVAVNVSAPVLETTDFKFRYAMAFQAEQGAGNYDLDIIGSLYTGTQSWLSPVEIFINGVSYGYLGGRGGSHSAASTHFTATAAAEPSGYSSFKTTTPVPLKDTNLIEFVGYARESNDDVVKEGDNVGKRRERVVFNLDALSAWKHTDYAGEWTVELPSDTVNMKSTLQATVKNGETIVTPSDVYSMTFKADSIQAQAPFEVGGTGLLTPKAAGTGTVTVEIRPNMNDESTVTATSAEVTVTDSDVYISNAGLTADGVSFNVNNTTETDYSNAVILVAAYDEFGRLEMVEPIIKTIGKAEGGAVTTVECSATSNVVGGATVRIMILKSWSDLEPLASAVEL